ncbi:hypothetical protein CRM79_21985 [Pantoea agglomerans]|nr:hypothetical protein [Pantoea agglomerans]PEI02262.1 hypothetical protein CRM79_21985 [Pantoea agglomerans]
MMSTVYCAHTPDVPLAELPARPEPIAFPPGQTALIVVDMQNAYATEGGYLDLAGLMFPRPSGDCKIHQAVTAARAAGMQIICFRMAGTVTTLKPVMPVPQLPQSNALKPCVTARTAGLAAVERRLGLRAGR